MLTSLRHMSMCLPCVYPAGVAVRARGGLENKRSIWAYSLSTTPKSVHTRRHPLRIIPRVGVVYIHHLTVRASHHIAEVIVLAQRE